MSRNREPIDLLDLLLFAVVAVSIFGPIIYFAIIGIIQAIKK